MAWAVLAVGLAIGGCGGGTNSTRQLSRGAKLAARLPADGSLNIAIVDVDAVRRSLGLDPGSRPPTGSDEDDVSFYQETDPTLMITRAADLPPAIIGALLGLARSIASVSGDRPATAISTSGDPSRFEGLLRGAGFTRDGEAFVDPKGRLAIAIGDGVIGIAASPGDAGSIVSDPVDGVPEPLEEVDGDGELVTIARFGARCLDSVATSDSIGKPGEVAFFTTATPEPARVRSEIDPPTAPRVVGDSIRVEVPAAVDPGGEPPALRALSDFSVGYDC